jgi:RNA polymerase sigma factor (sigma-70 family)
MQTPYESAVSDTLEDQTWLRSVFEQHQAALTTYAFQILGNLEGARDAVQDTFVRLCAEDLNPLRDRVAPWLYTVCRRRSLDLLRKGKRMQPLTDRESTRVADESRSPADLVEASDGARHLTRLLARLKPDQRDVLLLKFQHALSYQEIASVTGHSVSNVGFLLHTALNELRRRFAEEPSAGGVPIRRTP